MDPLETEAVDNEIDHNLNITAADAFLAGLHLDQLVDDVNEIDDFNQKLRHLTSNVHEFREKSILAWVS